MQSARFTTDLDVPLLGELDAAARFRKYPAGYTLKGLFFPRYVARLKEDWDAVRASLVTPPRFGRYMPFHNYPQVDFSRVAYAAALKSFPRTPPREAVRLAARSDFGVFGRSLVGGTVLGMLSDPGSLLLKLSDGFALMLEGGTVKTMRSGDGVRLEFDQFWGWLDCYVIGILEGGVQHFGFTPTIEVELLGPSRAAYEVRWR